MSYRELGNIMATNTDKIVLLNGSNFPTWKIQMKMLLIKEGVWGIVNETEDIPVDPGSYRHYVARQDRALSTIVLGINHSLLYMIGDPEDPVMVWRKLCAQFQKKSWANKLSLKKRLYNLKMSEGDSIQKHIKNMLEIFDELAIVGDPMEDEDRVVHLLASLPNSYEVLVTALEANAEVPELEMVIERLRHEESKLKEKVKTGNEMYNNALMSNGRFHKSGDLRKCFNCKKKGHISRNCEELKKKESANVSSENSRERRDSSSSSESDSEVVGFVVSQALLSSGPDIGKSKWVVDSGASCHMSNSKRMFSKLKPLEKPEMVEVGDGKFVEAEGKGSVKLSVNAGHSTKSCKLHDVLYIPDLSFNLFSVSKATEKGKSAEFTKKSCRFRDNEGSVVAIANKVGNLYYLDCRKSESAHLARTRQYNKLEERDQQLSTFFEERMKLHDRTTWLETVRTQRQMDSDSEYDRGSVTSKDSWGVLPIEEESSRCQAIGNTSTVMIQKDIRLKEEPKKASSKKKSFGKFKFWKICRSSANI